MKQIRQGCFETNSSSMHSLVIKKEDDFVSKETLDREMYVYRMTSERVPKWITEDDCGILTIYIRDEYDIHFERTPFKVIATIDDKICYYIASECETQEDLDNLNATLKEIFDPLKKIKYHTYDDFGKAKYTPYGYAENYGYFKKALKENQITLKDFLTNNKYIVIVDGDEYQEFTAMRDSGIINYRDIDKIYTWPDGGCELTIYDNDGNIVEVKKSWESDWS